jgi:hypothetical protein
MVAVIVKRISYSGRVPTIALPTAWAGGEWTPGRWIRIRLTDRAIIVTPEPARTR